MGGGNDKKAMDFPCIESGKKYHSFDNLKVDVSDKKPKLKIANGVLKPKNVLRRMRGKSRKIKQEVRKLKDKIKNNGKITTEDILNFLTKL